MAKVATPVPAAWRSQKRKREDSPDLSRVVRPWSRVEKRPAFSDLRGLHSMNEQHGIENRYLALKKHPFTAIGTAIHCTLSEDRSVNDKHRLLYAIAEKRDDYVIGDKASKINQQNAQRGGLRKNPPFSSTTNKPRSFDLGKPDLVDFESHNERSQRAESVLSGLSADDLEAAEAMRRLTGSTINKTTFNRIGNPRSPQIQQAPPGYHIATSTFNNNKPEPLTSLLTSAYPLSGSVNHDLSVYKTAGRFIPGGEWTERSIGLPLVGKPARITGIESTQRWALQPKKGSRNG